MGAALAVAGSPASAQTAPACPDVGSAGHAALGVPSPDRTCITLYPTPSAPDAGGVARLHVPAGPFTVAVDRDGVPRHRFVLEVAGLPDPATLGPYDRYVAWITPPTLAPMVALGTVTNGGVQLREEGGLNVFLLLISAEGPGPLEARTGPLVLRGASAGMVLRPHDLPWIVAEMAVGPDGAVHAHPDAGAPLADHRDHATAAAALPEGAAEWHAPPMHPSVGMPPALMALRPAVSPFLPWMEGGTAEGTVVPDARPRETVRLAHGDTLVLEAGPVYRRVGGLRIPGYGFNGQSPGPLIEAERGATVHVTLRNRTPLPTAVHWHGIRLDASSDGVPGLTQAAIPPGGDFRYTLRLPDEGTFWYHPHLREDVMQDMGLAGNLRVRPTRDADPYAPVDREEVLILDDHLIGPAGPVPYGREAPTHALMGRMGNVFLVNGREDWSVEVAAGDVVRFHLTNAANSRTFNLSFGDRPMKLVASDGGKLPVEVWVESVVLAPSERWVVDVHFPEAGTTALENRVQALDGLAARFFSEVHALGEVRARAEPGAGAGRAADTRAAFETLRRMPDAERLAADLLLEHAGQRPHRTLVLAARTEGLPFPLDPLVRWEGAYRPTVEWSGTMPEMDWLATGRAVTWRLFDPESGTENMDIDWRVRAGERLRLRLVNDRDGIHAMQHPIHLHGQRFLVLAIDDEPTVHPAWKDTVLVPTGAVVDVLIDFENPGPWMLHCHIAEHMETGMMMVIHVDPPEG